MTLRLLGIPFTMGDAAEVMASAEAQSRPHARLVVTANIDHIVILSENAAFRKAYESAVARTLDGTPLVWLARLVGARGVRRVTGHDLIDAALSGPAPDERRIFLVSANDEIGSRVADRFVAAGLQREALRGESPPFGFERDEAYGAALAERIRAHGTTLLLMGVGAPKSEIWVDRHAGALGDPVVLAIGEALSVAAGMVPRAPILMQRLGLEWFFRFLHSPQRLFNRYFVRSWRFLWIVASARSLGAAERARPRRTVPGWVLRTTKPK